MTVKFRCSECGRKISVNDVFAGGMCRCPLCRGFVFVPGEPASGGRLDRPEAPGLAGGHVSLLRRLGLRSVIAITAALLLVALAVILMIRYCLGR